MTAATSGPRYKRGFRLAIILAMLFMAGSAVQSAATLLFRIRGDVMRGGDRKRFGGQIGREVIYFVAAQLVLHFCFGVAIWILGLGNHGCVAKRKGPAWPARRRLVLPACRGRTIAYNVTWFPRTGLGAYYHDPAAIQIGPLDGGTGLYLGVTALAGLTLLRAAGAGSERLRFRRLTHIR